MAPLVIPDYAPGMTVQERFELFHKANPHVVVALEQLTRQYLASGRQRIGIAVLFERLRWEYDLRTSGDAFKLNNDFRSRYVRLIQDRRPEWAEVFRTRELRTA